MIDADRTRARSFVAALLMLAAAACGAGSIRRDDAAPEDPDARALDGGPSAADAASASDAPPAGPPDAEPGLVCPPVGALDCQPGPDVGSAQCFDGTSCYVDEVLASITAVIDAHPTWFSTDNEYGCHMILEIDPFLDGVITELTGRGLCAVRDPNAPYEEVTAKHDPAFSENFDIVASTGCARRSTGIYTGYCAPAWW